MIYGALLLKLRGVVLNVVFSTMLWRLGARSSTAVMPRGRGVAQGLPTFDVILSLHMAVLAG